MPPDNAKQSTRNYFEDPLGIDFSVLDEEEAKFSDTQWVLMVFARCGNIPSTFQQLQKIFDSIKIGNHTKISNTITHANNRARKSRTGIKHDSTTECLTKDYHRVCTKRAPNVKFRTVVAYIETKNLPVFIDGPDVRPSYVPSQPRRKKAKSSRVEETQDVSSPNQESPCFTTSATTSTSTCTSTTQTVQKISRSEVHDDEIDEEEDDDNEDDDIDFTYDDVGRDDNITQFRPLRESFETTGTFYDFLDALQFYDQNQWITEHTECLELFDNLHSSNFGSGMQKSSNLFWMYMMEQFMSETKQRGLPPMRPFAPRFHPYRHSNRPMSFDHRHEIMESRDVSHPLSSASYAGMHLDIPKFDDINLDTSGIVTETAITDGCFHVQSEQELLEMFEDFQPPGFSQQSHPRFPQQHQLSRTYDSMESFDLNDTQFDIGTSNTHVNELVPFETNEYHYTQNDCNGYSISEAVEQCQVEPTAEELMLELEKLLKEGREERVNEDKNDSEQMGKVPISEEMEEAEENVDDLVDNV